MQKNIKITTSIINFFNYDDTIEIQEYIDDYADILPEEFKPVLEDYAEEDLLAKAVDYVVKYITDNIEWAGDELDYLSLEDGYAVYNMIFKHNGKYYGVAYTESYDNGTELEGKARGIEDFPEFEPYTRTHYRPKAK